MNRKAVIFAVLLLLLLAPAASAWSWNPATWISRAFKIGDGKDIDLNQNSIGNGNAWNLTCQGNCTNFNGTTGATGATGPSETNASNLSTGTLALKLTKENVEWWGAIGDNITDDTTAFQNAINSSGYIKLNSSAVYKVSNLKDSGHKIVLDGGSWYDMSSTITGKGGSIRCYSSTEPCLNFSNLDSRFSSLKSLQIYQSPGTIGILINNNGLNLEQVYANGGRVAIQVNQSVVSTWNDVTAYGSQYGIYMNPTGSEAINLNLFMNVGTSVLPNSGTGYGAYIAGGGNTRDNTFINLDAEQSPNGIYSGGYKNTFMHPWTESITSVGILNTDSEAVFISRNIAGGTATIGPALDIWASGTIFPGYASIGGAFATSVAGAVPGRLSINATGGNTLVLLNDTIMPVGYQIAINSAPKATLTGTDKNGVGIAIIKTQKTAGVGLTDSALFNRSLVGAGTVVACVNADGEFVRGTNATSC